MKPICTIPECSKPTSDRLRRGMCKACYGKVSYRKNKKRHLATCKEYYNSHREQQLRNMKRWAKANPERSRAIKAAWEKRNPHKKQMAKMRRRALAKNALPKWVHWSDFESIYANTPVGYHVDHIVPLVHPAVCGLHVPWNLQYLSASDNYRKSNKFDGTYNNEHWKTGQ